MYAIRHKETGLWYTSSMGVSWIRKPNRDCLFWTKSLARNAMRVGGIDTSLVEIVAVEIVEKKDPRIVEQS